MSASESHEAIDRPALALPMFGAGVDVGLWPDGDEAAGEQRSAH